jgi:hypothetical protein
MLFGIDGTFASMTIQVTPRPSFWLSPLDVANGASPPDQWVFFCKRLLVDLLPPSMWCSFRIVSFVSRSVPRKWGLLSIIWDRSSVMNSNYFSISGILMAPIGLRNIMISVLKINLRGLRLIEMVKFIVLILKQSNQMFYQGPTASRLARGLIIIQIFIAQSIFMRGDRFFIGSLILTQNLAEQASVSRFLGFFFAEIKW